MSAKYLAEGMAVIACNLAVYHPLELRNQYPKLIVNNSLNAGKARRRASVRGEQA